MSVFRTGFGRLQRARLRAFGHAIAVFGALAGCVDSETSRQAEAVCGALAAERFEQALALSTDGASAEGAGREIAECRCIAMLSLGDRAGCTELLGPLLEQPAASDWVPHVVLTKLMLRTWQESGPMDMAAALAERAAPIYRDDLDLLQLEVMLRSSQADEVEVLREIEERLSPGPDWLPQRLVLALGWTRRSQYDDAIRVLGETPPPIEHPLALPWFESLIQAQAASGDLAAVQSSFERWRATGWDPVDLDARYALRMSVEGLRDPGRHNIDLLRDAIATQDQLSDPRIVWGLHRRLIQELLGAGLPERALEAYDAAIRVVTLDDLSREQIERAVRLADGNRPADPTATLVFHGPPDLPNGRLAISPGPNAPPDAGYTDHALAAGSTTRVTTREGLHPTRWVLRDEAGAVRGSGAIWPEAGRTLEVHPQPTPPATLTARPAAPEVARDLDTRDFGTRRRPADGERRVIAILADCADWRLTEYLRERGELPFHDHLFSEGFRAVLESRPAFTAAAMQALVWPSANERRGSLDWIHDLGLELAGLESVGRNPLDFLSLVLPTRPNLFETLGAGPVVTANMLLAHGRIDAGRHAELIGPDGERRALASQKAYRVLDEGERSRHPALMQDANTKKFAETIAAEMDVALQIVREGEVDFLFLRLEAVDLMTHGYFGALDGRGQDDARGPLTATYRYIDERLAELHALMDEDDWLVYLSDHGIRSSMEHEEDALFVVLGAGVPSGRAPGRPALRGVPHSLAAMFQLDTAWPETGTTPWLGLAEIERSNEAPRESDGPHDPTLAARP